MIDIGKLKADGILKFDELGPSRDVDPVDGRTDWCHAGFRGGAPISVGIVVGQPFPSLDALLPSYLEQRHQVSVGADHGLIGVSSIGGDRTLALQHGDAQLLLTNSGLSDILGKKLDDAGMTAVAQDMVGKLPQSIPDAPRDVPALCDQIQGIRTIIGPVTLARGRADAVLTSCDFVGGTKHLLLTVSFTKMNRESVAQFTTDNSPARLSLISNPLFPGTLSRGHRDGSGLALETMVDDRIVVSTYYNTLCYDGCRKYGVITPGTTIGTDDRALIASAIDLARSMK
ncbi:hypothetical protein [Nocardia sp. NBC_01388]|uniref:hypothetical protein n=1 Tax=Nocardia sp. NBC_01388 TaxID=2903596 RepID=UPI0032531E44